MSGPSSFRALDMQECHFEMTMDLAYVYNKVRSLLAVFVAFKVLNDEDKKRQGSGSEEEMKGAI